MNVKTEEKKEAEVVNKNTGERWVYSDVVKDHFFHPRNLLLENVAPGTFDAEGMVGSPACGDVMYVWIKVEKESEKIKEFKWKTFGCGSAIASSSMFSVMTTENEGMTLADALKINTSVTTLLLDDDVDSVKRA